MCCITSKGKPIIVHEMTCTIITNSKHHVSAHTCDNVPLQPEHTYSTPDQSSMTLLSSLPF